MLIIKAGTMKKTPVKPLVDITNPSNAVNRCARQRDTASRPQFAAPHLWSDGSNNRQIRPSFIVQFYFLVASLYKEWTKLDLEYWDLHIKGCRL